MCSTETLPRRCSVGGAPSRSDPSASTCSTALPRRPRSSHVTADVAEVVYAGPITRVASTLTGVDGLPGTVRLTATLLFGGSIHRHRSRHTRRAGLARHGRPRSHSGPTEGEAMSLTFRRLGVALAAGALLVAGCSSSGDSGGTAEGPPAMEAATRSATARASSTSSPGRATRRAVQRSGRRLGHAVRAGNRLQGQRQARQHVRRDGSADAYRPIRRGVGLGRRHAAVDLRRRRGPGQHRAHPQLHHVVPFFKDKPWNSVDGQMYGIPHGWGANLLM